MKTQKSFQIPVFYRNYFLPMCALALIVALCHVMWPTVYVNTRHNDNKIKYHNISHLWVGYMYVVFFPRFGTYEIGLKTWKHGHYFKCWSFAGLFFFFGRIPNDYSCDMATVVYSLRTERVEKPAFLGPILREKAGREIAEILKESPIFLLSYPS